MASVERRREYRHRRDGRTNGIENRRLAFALLVSLIIHVPLVSLTFYGEGFGLPGIGFSWWNRRIEAPDLIVELMPPPAPLAEPAVPSVAQPLPQGPVEQSSSSRPVPTPSAPSAPQETAILPSARPTQDTEARADSARALPRTEESANATLIEAIELPVTDVAPDNQVEGARQEAVRQEAARQAAAALETQRQEAARQEAARIEAARQEFQRQESARQAAAALEAQRQEAARQEAARIEAARQEFQRQETARQAAAALETQRQETARQEAVRLAAAAQEAQRQEAARQEAARIEAGRQEAQRRETARQAAAALEVQRQEAARQEAARIEAARQEAERQSAAQQAPVGQQVLQAEQEEAAREERLRAIGRQLDEERARREAASIADRQPNALPLSLSNAHRVKLYGRTHPNVELIRYAEAWALRIQGNTAIETINEVAKQPHNDPVVTVAIRSDGSVESVTFEVSSGVAKIDDAVRQIVERQYPRVAFPDALAREYDVVEIRRTWHFDTVIRLY